MLRSFLILSMDQGLLATRVLVLRSSGFTAVGATRIGVALKLAKSVQPSVGIICHTLSASEQSMFVDALIRVCPNIFIMRLRQGEVNPHRLVADCELCFAPQDAAERTLAFHPAASRRAPRTDNRPIQQSCHDKSCLQWTRTASWKWKSQNG
jgi:hypothetical protein